MALSDEDRARIEEEELYRAEARIRAEAEIRRRIALEEAQSAAAATKAAATAKAKSDRRSVGCFVWVVGSIIALMVLNDLGKSTRSPSSTGGSVSAKPVTTPETKAATQPEISPVPPPSPEERAAAEKKAAEEAEIARKKAEEQAAAAEDSRQYNQNLKWWYSESPDDMGRGTVRTAYVQSQNQVSFDFPYTGAQRATLTLRVHPKYGKDVILRIDKGQFLCGYDGCRVSVVFGEGKPVSFSAAGAADHSSEVLFLRDYDRFLSNLRKVGRVRIEAGFFQQGERTFEFNVKDLQWK